MGQRNGLKGSLVQNRSSYFMAWPVITAALAGCLVSFILENYPLSLLLLIVFLVMLFARLWSAHSAKKCELYVKPSVDGVFPGERLSFYIRIKNNKFLPLICMQLYMPIGKELTIIPEDVRDAEEIEKLWLKEIGASEDRVGEKDMPTILWYETRTVKSVWSANRRGVYSTSGWRLRVGDGFGLSQTEIPVDEKSSADIAVFPRKVNVKTDIFMRMSWNADTGTTGVMEDITVIRSTRGYLSGDPVKHINWRLLSRGLPLQVNTYDETLPQSIFFIFDGESFADKDDMEDALSIISSVIIELSGKVQAGISFSGSRMRVAPQNGCTTVGLGRPVEDMLWAMAAYEPASETDNEAESIPAIENRFDIDAIGEEEQKAGRIYLVISDADKVAGNPFSAVIDDRKLTILSYMKSERTSGMDIFCLKDLKEPEDGK